MFSTFILCSRSNLDSALEKGGGDFGGELGSSRLRSRLVYLVTRFTINTSITITIIGIINMMKTVCAYLLESPPMSESYSFSEA